MNDRSDIDGSLRADDQRLMALTSFKDWSNYLLVTTVAAVGWVASSTSGNQSLLDLAVWCFGISLVFGIFTLALVPLVAEQIGKGHDSIYHDSIYKVPASFKLFWSQQDCYLTQACRPQHLLFIAGVILYCAAVTRGDLLAVFVPSLWLAALVIFRQSHPPNPS